MIARILVVLFNTSVLLLLLTMLLVSSPLTCNGAMLLPGLEDDQSIKKVDNGALETMRGRYFDIYFSINVSGYLNNYEENLQPVANITFGFGGGDGTGTNQDSGPPPLLGDPVSFTLDGNGGAGESSGSGTAARIDGAFEGSNGAFQVTQVPGSNNLVQTAMDINLWLVNVEDTSTADSVRSALSQLLLLP